MKQLLAIWLGLQDKDKKYLQKTVIDLGKEYKAPIFTPHLTILGDTIISLNDLKNAIDKTFKNAKVIKIKKTQISQSEVFFKTVFIEFEKDKILNELSENLIKNLPKKSDYIFKPHISLLYKTLPEKERIKIVDRLNIKKEFIIDKVIINAPGLGEKDFLNIKTWRNLYELSLND